MNSPVAHFSDRATAEEIALHLDRCDADFVPPLSGRLRITDYAGKLARLSSRFEAWSGDELVGLVAAYWGAPEELTAHISNVSVLKAWTGQGIAAALVERCIAQARERGIARITLEVAEENLAAVRLYARKGFTDSGRNDGVMTMTLDLKRK